MAQSPAHKFGQIIGDAVEAAIEPLLQGFAGKNCLYLDKRGNRPARSGKKVTWKDADGNKIATATALRGSLRTRQAPSSSSACT